MAEIPITSATTAGESANDMVARYLRPGTLNLTALPPLSLYVHLPWCLKKCPYCDFNSHEARGDVPEDVYVETLLKDEPEEWFERW